MTARDRGRIAARWLGAQALAFGAVAAFLGIAANSLFLHEYGSEWLPVTYLFIAVAGVVVSGTIARSARGGGLVRIATVVLAGSMVVFVVSWVIAAGWDGLWVSAPLLVLFPVLLQLGFVFIGGQAGQILDIAGIKSLFPRIVAGFPIGAVIGSVLAVPILGATGNTESLLLATAVAQALFLAVLLLTARRYSVELRPRESRRARQQPSRWPSRRCGPCSAARSSCSSWPTKSDLRSAASSSTSSSTTAPPPTIPTPRTWRPSSLATRR